MSELSQSRREDLEAFASRLPDVYPRLWSWLEPSVRAEFGIEIGKIEKTHDYPAVRQAMTRLREAITKRAGVDKKIDL